MVLFSAVEHLVLKQPLEEEDGAIADSDREQS
jgi:hypothetical protein